MASSDPFGFDLRVSSDKKKRTRGRRGMSGAFETSQRVCEHPGCQEPGKYRAPKSPDSLDDFYWFCKTHVREYNLKWNFFEGTTEEELSEHMDNDRVWERKTKPFRQSAEERAWSRLGVDDPHQVLGQNATRNPGKSITGTRRLPPTERRALEILDAKDHWTRTEIRKSYKALIKILHPDMNGGDRSDEERLQEVMWAWDQVKESRNFKE
ncbi:DnaJ domain-containing protein [Roseicyclus sp. F158]|uniref:DnaJ domain-containing protein n=1 Tax=Tropicimonas omnivorans TaxID=3075590 RepID=A0ABU3DJ07_9RHOB|nr:DnaJ domain-containing protein [Roseicyclus sp. F158]MDT0683705.1 DnaJ domain-containing protein [Roseicyclus sp. F158]